MSNDDEDMDDHYDDFHADEDMLDITDDLSIDRDNCSNNSLRKEGKSSDTCLSTCENNC
jgi:hypothetical protein